MGDSEPPPGGEARWARASRGSCPGYCRGLHIATFKTGWLKTTCPGLTGGQLESAVPSTGLGTQQSAVRGGGGLSEPVLDGVLAPHRWGCGCKKLAAAPAATGPRAALVDESPLHQRCLGPLWGEGGGGPRPDD